MSNQPATAAGTAESVAADPAPVPGGDAYDVVTVGGGAAGLSGAVALGRARRSVVVIDSAEPRNAPAAGVHNFLTRDGVAPAELIRMGRAEAESYGARILPGEAVSAQRDVAGFTVTTADGTTVRGRRLLLSSGLADELPDVPGLRARWGRDVLHCPYCHGWEVRDRAIGILGTGSAAMHQTMLFRQWSERVTLFVNTAPQPTTDERERFAARGIEVVEGIVESLAVEDDVLVGVTVAGRRIPVDALVVSPMVAARTELAAGLGLDVVIHPMGIGTLIASGPGGSTSVPGVWVAGNVTDPMAQVIASAAAGLMAGAAINADLIAAEFDVAVAAHRKRMAGR